MSGTTTGFIGLFVSRQKELCALAFLLNIAAGLCIFFVLVFHYYPLLS
jgi:hypothetical protein